MFFITKFDGCNSFWVIGKVTTQTSFLRVANTNQVWNLIGKVYINDLVISVAIKCKAAKIGCDNVTLLGGELSP